MLLGRLGRGLKHPGTPSLLVLRLFCHLLNVGRRHRWSAAWTLAEISMVILSGAVLNMDL